MSYDIRFLLFSYGLSPASFGMELWFGLFKSKKLVPHGDHKEILFGTVDAVCVDVLSPI